MASPSPFPAALVVKYGSKILPRFSGGMPTPVSLTVNSTYRPAASDGDDASSSISRAATTMVPLPGMAWAAFRTRFWITCWIWTGSTSTGGSAGGSANSQRTFEPCRTKRAEVSMSSAMEAACLMGAPPRANVSSWRESPAARMAAALASSSSAAKPAGAPSSFMAEGRR